MSDVILTPSQQALEQTGLEFLRLGKFRKARDAFKSLNKSHPFRALPRLIKANLGLAQEMAAKVQVNEANQILAYLKTIASAGFDLNFTPAVAAKNARDAWSSRVPQAAERLATSPPLTDAAICAADEMILGASSPDHPCHPDAHAILTALELGYGADASAETEKSLLHSAISALLTICSAPATRQSTPRTVRARCSWAGLPNLAEPLLLADPLWRKKEHSKAFSLLTKKVPGLFCLGARSFNADLTRLLTTEFIADDLGHTDYFRTVLECVSHRSRTVANAAVDRSFFSIEFARYDACAHRHFSMALENIDTISAVAPIHPAMLSRIFTHLVEGYITAVKKDFRDQCSSPNAKKALEHALKHEPDNLRAWLMQCDLLAMGKDTSTYHRFLDDLTKRYPAHKEVLIRNGDCCTGRKSYTKALRNFENAAKIDSVDPRITRGILRAQLGVAEEAYKKRTPDKAKWDLIDSLASTDPSDAEYSLWRLRVHRIVLEISQGTKEADLIALVTATLPLAPNAFSLETACRFAILDRKSTLKEKTLGVLFPSSPCPESLADFLAVMDESAALDEGNHHIAAKRIAQNIFATHQPLFLRLVAVRKDLTTLLIRIFRAIHPDLSLVCPVIEQWLRRDPTDPLLGIICWNYRFPWLKVTLEKISVELATLLLESPDAAAEEADEDFNDANSGDPFPIFSAQQPATAAPDSSELLQTAKQLRHRAEALLAQEISADDSTEINTLLEKTRHAIAASDWTPLSRLAALHSRQLTVLASN